MKKILLTAALCSIPSAAALELSLAGGYPSSQLALKFDKLRLALDVGYGYKDLILGAGVGYEVPLQLGSESELQPYAGGGVMGYVGSDSGDVVAFTLIPYAHGFIGVKTPLADDQRWNLFGEAHAGYVFDKRGFFMGGARAGISYTF